jgi:anti-anti-sigma factor
MDFNATIEIDDDAATIRLDGQLDRQSAPVLQELIVRAADAEVNRLVLLMHGLEYMSSAGLRCLVFAHQKMPGDTDIVLVGATPAVAETVRLTGFDRSVTMQETGV